MIRGLSLTQPWAMLVAVGAKKFETRSWGTRYRGRLAIHAAKNFPVSCRLLCEREPFRSALRATRLEGFASGRIIAVVDLVDCIWITAENAPAEPEFSFGDYTPGRWMWRLENVRRLPASIACKGALALWAVPAEIAAQLAMAQA